MEAAARARSIEIAETVRAHIGRGALFMIAARDFGALSEEPKGERLVLGGLSFWVKCRGSKVKSVKIELMADDTYDVTFYWVRGSKIRIVSEHSGIYCDMLRSLIGRESGLAVSL